MCHIYASQPPSSYECQTRSIRIHGHCTSLRLEAAFWATLEEMVNATGWQRDPFAADVLNPLRRLQQCLTFSMR